MRIKKVLACIFVVVMAFTVLTACGGNQDDGVVVIYTPLRQEFMEPIIEAFEEETGIRVEALFAGTGEILSRIRAEAENPMADVMWGGILSMIPSIYLFEDHYSINEPYMLPGFNNEEGPLTRFNLNGNVLIVNTDLIGDIQIRGYADLLNPELRGQIAHTDPAASSSAFNHLVNQLYAMGNGDPEAGWEYMEAFVDNLDGVMLGGSSAVIRGVADGEYKVGLTFEEGPFPYITAGAPVKVVYMEEGVLFTADIISIVKDAPNMENARLFVDFVTGHDIQVIVQESYRRAARSGLPQSDVLVPLEQINQLEVDLDHVLNMRDEWLDRFREIWER
jgi:iron(III) transport system substrate-binding protein